MPEIAAPKMPAPRLIIPGLGGLYGALSFYAEPLLRFVIGALLVPTEYRRYFIRASTTWRRPWRT